MPNVLRFLAPALTFVAAASAIYSAIIAWRMVRQMRSLRRARDEAIARFERDDIVGACAVLHMQRDAPEWFDLAMRTGAAIGADVIPPGARPSPPAPREPMRDRPYS